MGMQWPFAGGGGGLPPWLQNTNLGNFFNTGQNPLGNNPTATPSPGPAVPPPAPTANTAPVGPAPGAAPAPTGVMGPPQTGGVPQTQQNPAPPPAVPGNLLPQPGGVNNGMNSPALYSQFLNWWMTNMGGNPPSMQDWLNGNLGVAQGGGQQPAQPGGPTNSPGIPDIGTPGGPVDYNSLAAFNEYIRNQLGAASPGLPIGDIDFLSDSRLNPYRAGSGGWLGGPGLPGEGADALAGMDLNLLFNEAGLQGGRMAEAESLLRDVMERLGASEALGTSRQASALAGERLSPESLSGLRSSMEGDLSTSLAAERNASTNALRELGLLGQGATAGAALGGLTNRLGGLRQRGMFDIERMMEDLTGQRLQQGAQAGGAGADVERALGRDPVYALVQSLQGPRNPVLGDIRNTLEGFINVLSGQALSNRGGSFLNSGGGQLIGSALGALGGLGGAAIKGVYDVAAAEAGK